MNNKKKKQNNDAIKYIQKWLSILSIVLAIGGVFAFGFVVFLANVFGETVETYNPIWMIFMIPLMFLIATPITIFIARTFYRHIDVLTKAMNDVANGKSDVQIKASGKAAFASVYEDFNKMAAEIAGIEALRIQLVDGFSHELKTPIASINGFAKMLLEDNSLNDEKRQKYLKIIIKESERLASLSQNNLLLSKIDATEIVTDKKSFNLGKQIQEIAISLESSWTAKNIILSAELPDIEFFGNEDLISCVWQNLLTNAIKFTPKNGEISISLKKDKNNITVSVSDTGIGMSDEVLEHAFERYYQGDSSHASEGHGLGLSIVKRIAVLCGGEVEVKSQEGEGSTFSVILPV